MTSDLKIAWLPRSSAVALMFLQMKSPKGKLRKCHTLLHDVNTLTLCRSVVTFGDRERALGEAGMVQVEYFSVNLAAYSSRK